MSGYTDHPSLGGPMNPEVDFLQKPFTPESLTRKVREKLDEPLALRNSGLLP